MSKSVPRILSTKEGQPVNYDGVRISFRGNFDIDCDGSGGNPDGDPDFQPRTSYKPHGNSIDPYKIPGGVIPEDLIPAVPGAILGCLGICTDLRTGKAFPFVVTDAGPPGKIGEGTPELARRIGLNPNARHGGWDKQDFLWEIFPGIPAVIDGVFFPLQPIRST